MHDDRPAGEAPARPPKTLIDRVTAPLSRFLRIETAGGAVLLVCTLAALILSKSRWADPFLAVFVEFVLGKPIGVVSFSWLAVRTGVAARPPDLDWRSLTGGGILAGIGFTMALFIANLAFDPGLADEAKVGILAASVVSAAAGLALLNAESTPGRRDARPVRGGAREPGGDSRAAPHGRDRPPASGLVSRAGRRSGASR